MGDTRNTMSRSSLPKYKAKVKPSCLPGISHHWGLETAQQAAGEGRVGTSDGVCIYCESQYTFLNSIIDFDPRAHQQLFLGRPT